MAGSLVAHKRTIQSRTKVKTGCATCRIRKIKCDENKPFCKKCTDTSRTCDGYESPFRLVTSQATGTSSSPQRTPAQIASQDVDLLNRYFSIKTMFDVKLACDDEARQVLQASLTDLPIQHAVSSLKVLREDLQTSRGVPGSVAQPTANHDYGLQKYCRALRGLASTLSSPDSDALRSTLLCCQVFISIEQVRGNYAAMAQHIIQGLGIMRENRARPNFVVAANELVPARRDQLPFLDVFVVKLFAAPCKYVDPPASTAVHQQPIEIRRDGLRTIAPDKRKGLTDIAESTLEFLDEVSRVESAGDALELLSEKASLLGSLGLWLAGLELDNAENRVLTELISVLFMRFFHQILKTVLLGVLDSSPEGSAQLQIENERLQGIASEVGERVKDYFRTVGGTAKWPNGGM
ncbi:hypothetical protein B0H67DRAFT_480276 [Lasiosphaeris hirsuta]|uniref:Zn(2)-C6 fungal-type domain-containing protein n=1 Tax=Lasiosphaeris hirsuta TaxID=260670 RepID=A0AA40AXZ8_9PEZI|nr:hypothetical protein B0H67DRAFT_480276 [Lasiosphaeris hirsuta]